MTPRDAFELPYLLTEVTLAPAARVHVEKHGAATSRLSEVADRLDTEPFFQRIDALLSRAKLPTLPRPMNASELRTWSQTVGAAVPKTEAVAQLGHGFGLVLQNLRLHELVLPLVDASPDDLDLAMREALLRETRAALVANLGRQAGLPVELRATPAQLVTLLQPANPLARAPAHAQVAVLRDVLSALRREVGRIASALQGELTRPTISPQDAFLTTLQTGEVGVPYLGLEFTDVALMTSTPALEQHIAKQQHGYRAVGPQLGARIVEIEERLRRNQLPVPPRPNSYATCLTWSDAIAHAIGAVTGPDQPAGASAALGRAIGQAMLTLSSLAVVMRLREVDDANAELVFYQQKFEKALGADAERLTGMSTFTTLPATVKPHVVSMATLMRMLAGARIAAISTQRAGDELALRRMAELITTVRSLFV